MLKHWFESREPKWVVCLVFFWGPRVFDKQYKKGNNYAK